MHIRKLSIGRFAGLSSVNMEFTDRINIIEGNNESGKSTVSAFIRYIFFGLSGRKENGISDRKRYMPFDSDTVYGSMDVEYDGKEYRIERKTSMSGKVAVKESVTIKDISTGEECYKGKEPGDVFLSMSEGLFRKTAYVSQLDGTKVEGSEVRQALENIMSSADDTVNTEKALKLLDGAKVSIMYKNEKGGRLFALQSEKEKLKTDMERSKESEAQYAQAEEDLKYARNKDAENDRLLEEAEDRVRLYNDAKWLKEFDEYNAKSKEYENVTDQFSTKMPKSGIPSTESILSISRLAQEIREKERVLEEAREDTKNYPVPEKPEVDDIIIVDGGEEYVINRLKRAKKRMTSKMSLAVTFAVLMLVAIAAATVLLLFGIGPAFLYIILFALGGGLGVASLVMLTGFSGARAALLELYQRYNVESPEEIKGKVRECDAVMEKYEKEKALAENARKNAVEKEKEYKKVADSAREICETYDTQYIVPDTLDHLATTLTKTREELNSLAERMRSLHEACDAMETRLRGRDEAALREKNIDIEEALKINIDEEERRVKTGKAASPYLKTNIKNLEKKTRETLESEGSVIAMKTRLGEIASEELELKERYDALGLAEKKLKEASSILKGNVSPRLAKSAGELISEATKGKYDRLFVSGDLSISYQDSSHGGMVRESDFMSKGTVDLAYIALRISLCDVISENNPLPLIFDESFAVVDDDRLTDMYEIIKKRNMQTIIFTSQKREGRIMKESNLIKLDKKGE